MFVWLVVSWFNRLFPGQIDFAAALWDNTAQRLQYKCKRHFSLVPSESAAEYAEKRIDTITEPHKYK